MSTVETGSPNTTEITGPGLSWAAFARLAPELAAFGRERFSSGVAYLGTVRPDGSPRVHPVTPIIGENLFLFMEPTSPKGRDLERDGRYSLHCAVANMDGGEGEFYLRGRARRVLDPALRKQAERAAPYELQEQYILFLLSVEFAYMKVYTENGARVQHWRAEAAND